MDKMAVNHGETEILVAARDQHVIKAAAEKKKATVRRDPVSIISVSYMVGGRGFEPPTPAV
jgi:hypothetical protein